MEKNNSDLKKWLILILVAIVAYWGINNLATVGSVINTVIDIIFPFILGGDLAYILNIPMSFFERKFTRTEKKKKAKKKTKLKRILAIILSVIVIIFILTLIITLIVPELVNIFNLLIDNIPYYVQEITKFAQNYSQELPNINNFLQNLEVENLKKEAIDQGIKLLTSSISVITNVFSGIATFFIAIFFAMYILIDKEKLKEQTKKLIKAYLGEKRAEKIINVGRISNNIFRSFFTVQCLEATILGVLCILGMLILRIPYAVPIGVLVGVTALIPVVGCFIGIIIGAILILSINPIKVITFIIFVLILQQVDGNVIYPRVVGSSVGLPGMWVLVAVSVGGSLGGILGMLIGVPIASIIYTLVKKDVNKKLNKVVE